MVDDGVYANGFDVVFCTAGNAGPGDIGRGCGVGNVVGYAAVAIPGVNESMDRDDLAGAAAALEEVTAALERAASVLGAALGRDEPL